MPPNGPNGTRNSLPGWVSFGWHRWVNSQWHATRREKRVGRVTKAPVGCYVSGFCLLQLRQKKQHQEGRSETLEEQVGRDASRSRMCTIAHILPATGIRHNSRIIKSLLARTASTPPMPPPWLAPHHRGSRRSLRLAEHRREHRAEQRREQRLVQRIEQLLDKRLEQPRIQFEGQCEIQLAIQLPVQRAMRAGTQPAMLPTGLPDEQRTVPGRA